MYRNNQGAPLAQTRALETSLKKEIHWYDIYSESRKIGFASVTKQTVGTDIIIEEEREIMVMKEGRDKVLKTWLKCISDSQFSIKTFEYSSSLDGEISMKATGEVDKESVIIMVESPEKRKVLSIPTDGRGFHFPMTFIPAIISGNPVPQSAVTVPVLDTNSLSITDAKITLEEIRPIKIGIIPVSIYKFRSGNSAWWSNEDGSIIKEENQHGLTLYSVNAAYTHDYKNRLLADYTQIPLIQANRLLSNPEKLIRLKVKIQGFTLDHKLYENSRVLLDNDIIVVEKDDLTHREDEPVRLPYTDDAFRQYLHPDQWVVSDYKPLHDTGVIYARANNNDAFLFVQYLTSYLFNLVKPEPTFFIRDAEHILKSLRGDHAERTVLFASYSRAAGLPTRLVGGFVYMHGYFYFHIWPEVWLKRWVPVDPTLYQFPADVTHIPLREGTMGDIVSLIDDLKGVTIEVMEAS